MNSLDPMAVILGIGNIVMWYRFGHISDVTFIAFVITFCCAQIIRAIKA